jgi:hypothetical protein
MKKMVLLVLLVFLGGMVMVPGCATTTNVTPIVESPYGQLAIRYAVIRFLADDQEKVGAALRIVEKVHMYVINVEELAIPLLQKEVVGLIAWDNMHPADRYLLESLIELIATDLANKVGADLLDEVNRIRVLTYINWIEDVIRSAILG